MYNVFKSTCSSPASPLDGASEAQRKGVVGTNETEKRVSIKACLKEFRRSPFWEPKYGISPWDNLQLASLSCQPLQKAWVGLQQQQRMGGTWCWVFVPYVSDSDQSQV